MATTHVKPKAYDLFRLDRPGWIPESVGDDWDPHPYAYQTREELMPAGHLHSLYLIIFASMLRPVLDRLGLRMFVDVFIFYRDWEGRKQRIGPDAVIASAREPIPNESAHKYDLDREPIPLCAVEVISPSSREADLHGKRLFYASLGIQEYIVFDVEDDNEQALEQIGISLWRMQAGVQHPVPPDAEGFLTLKSVGVRIRADGKKLVVQDIVTGALLRDTIDLQLALEATEQARLQAEQARLQAEQQAETEATARKQAEAEVTALRAALEQLQRSSEAS